MSNQFFRAAIFLLILVLAACSSSEEPLPTRIPVTATPSPEPTQTSTAIPPTATPIEVTSTLPPEPIQPTQVEVSDASPPIDEAACAALVEAAYDQTRTACADIGDDQACYGNVSIEPEPATLDFNETGDIAPVAEIQSLRLSSMDTQTQEWGISLMRLFAAESGQSVELLLFGNVQLDAAGTSDSGLRAYTFTSGADDRPCEAAPDSGILVQTPQGVGEITLLINEVVIDLGSTAFLQSQPGAEMSVNTLEGQATVTSNGMTVLAPAGTRTRIPIDASGVAAGAPSDPEPYTDSPLVPLPVTLLPRSVTIAPPAEVIPVSRTLGAVNQVIPVSGELDPTSSHIYFFNAAVGQLLYFYNLIEGEGCCLSWQLFKPDGTSEFSTAFSTDYRDIRIENAGRYKLILESVSEFTGTYAGQIGLAPEPETFSIQPGDTIAPDSPAPGAGRIEAVGAQDVYTFTVEAGKRIFLEPLSANGTNQIEWFLTDEDGSTIFTTPGFDEAFNQDHVLERGGTYTLTLDGQQLFTGEYSFKLWDVAPTPSTSIALDDPLIQGNIEVPGAQNLYTFAAEAGQQIFIEAPEGGCCDFYWILTDESGEQILQTASVDGTDLILESGGTYTLLVDGIDDNIGAYSFRILTVLRSETSSIALDGPFTRGGIDAPGEQDVYTFTAEAGQQIFIEATEGDCCDFYWILTDENGEQLLQTAGVNGSELTVENGGTFTLVIDGIEGNTGPYNFRVLSVAPSQTSEIALDGPLTEGSIDAPGEQDEYTFTAEAGQDIFIDAPVGGCCDFYWIISDESGEQILYTAGVDDNEATLEAGGTYTLVIDGIESNTGPYSFQIFRVVPPQTFEFPLGSVVEGSIETFGTEDIYTFSVEQGQTVFITKLEEDIPSGLLYFSLIDEEGEFVFQDRYFNVRVVEPFTLVRGGLYELHAYGYADTLGTYSLRIALDPFGVRPLDGDFVRQWASSATASSQYSDPNWAASQAIGEPDTFQCGDIVTAWASLSSTGMDTLELRYDQPVIPERIDIYQTYTPGSITQVQLIDEDGELVSLPNTADPPGNTLCPGVFSFDVDDITRPVDGIVITLDQTIGGSWNEIDAVELIGTLP